ncbi:MAG: proteasome-activating nucleotidase [Sulfolobales archaeon]|nr:proteasome-activating nucleotidase [Sulfolobales archaeon]
MSGDVDSFKERLSVYDPINLKAIYEEKINELMRENERLRDQLNYYKNELEKLTSPPLIEGTLIEVLPDDLALVKSSTGPVLIVQIDPRVDRSKLVPGVSVALTQRNSAVVRVLPGREDPLVRALEVIEKPNVRYSDIGGLSEQIRELREVVELPLVKPHLFGELGIDPPKGVLLYGPPGTGKTLLAKAVAAESNATFIHVVASEFAQKFVGEGARMVKEVFALARRKAPAIVFIDEIDAIGARRIELGTSGEREVQRTLMQLLAEIDGFKPLDNVKIIAATNRLDILDPALLRPGRFDRLIEVPLPDFRGRKEIFEIYLKKVKKCEEINVELLASLTEGFSGAEIKSVVTEAGYVAIRKDRTCINNDDLMEALQTIEKKRFKESKKDTGGKYA